MLYKYPERKLGTIVFSVKIESESLTFECSRWRQKRAKIRAACGVFLAVDVVVFKLSLARKNMLHCNPNKMKLSMHGICTSKRNIFLGK